MAPAPRASARANARIGTPAVQPLVLAFFSRYAAWMLARQFHSVRLARCGSPPALPNAQPLVVFLNHASWWDPLVSLWLAQRFFPQRQHFGPMQADQLRRYGILRRIGMFGVERGTAGARDFLKTSAELLTRPGATLWLTPQARFADVRERPARFAPGLAHLLPKVPGIRCVSLALEYGFGEERLPEIRIRFGTLRTDDDWSASGVETHPAALGAALERELEDNQDRLARLVCSGAEGCFETLFQSTSGTSLPYDLWRRVRAAFGGVPANLNHSRS